MKTLYLIPLVLLSLCGMPQTYPPAVDTDTLNPGIYLFPRDPFIREGKSQRIFLLSINSDGTRTEISPENFALEIHGTSVMVLDGCIVALSPGTSIINAYYMYINDSISVTVTPIPDYTKLRISEVMANPDNDPDGEYIEIFNSGSQACDLTGVSLVDGAATSKAFVFQGIVIQPGKFIVTAHSSQEFTLKYVCVPDAYPLDFGINNSNETIFLKDPDGATLDIVYISNGTDNWKQPPSWGTLKTEKSKSITRKDPTTDSDTAADFENREPSPGR